MCTQTIEFSEWSVIDTALTWVSYRVKMFRCFKLNAVLNYFSQIMHKHRHSFLGTSVFDCMSDYLRVHTLA